MWKNLFVAFFLILHMQIFIASFFTMTKLSDSEAVIPILWLALRSYCMIQLCPLFTSGFYLCVKKAKAKHIWPMDKYSKIFISKRPWSEQQLRLKMVVFSLILVVIHYESWPGPYVHIFTYVSIYNLARFDLTFKCLLKYSFGLIQYKLPSRDTKPCSHDITKPCLTATQMMHTALHTSGTRSGSAQTKRHTEKSTPRRNKDKKITTVVVFKLKLVLKNCFTEAKPEPENSSTCLLQGILRVKSPTPLWRNWFHPLPLTDEATASKRKAFSLSNHRNPLMLPLPCLVHHLSLKKTPHFCTIRPWFKSKVKAEIEKCGQCYSVIFNQGCQTHYTEGHISIMAVLKEPDGTAKCS